MSTTGEEHHHNPSDTPRISTGHLTSALSQSAVKWLQLMSRMLQLCPTTTTEDLLQRITPEMIKAN